MGFAAVATASWGRSVVFHDDMRMTFWLVNSGTTDDPLPSRPGAVRRAFENWEASRGPVHGLDRAYAMLPGDLLIYRSVGTPVSRLVAVGTVLARPEAKPFMRWKFQVRREITDLVGTLRYGPPFDLLETAPVRMTKRLEDAVGNRAVELIRSAAARSKDT